MAQDELYAIRNEANILAIQKVMGYNYAIEKVARVENITAGNDTTINFVVNNEGVAPFYYDWPLEFSLINDNGDVVYTKTTGSGITNWLPGRTSVDAKLFVSNAVPAGEYTLAIAIADKDSKEPAVRLAMEGGREDLRYPLYKINLSSTGNAADDPAPYVPAGPGANAGASAGAAATESESSSTSGPATPATAVTQTEPVAPQAGQTTTAPATGNAAANNDNAEPDTAEEAVADAGNVGAQTAETIIGEGETALVDGLGTEDETPSDNAGEAVTTAATSQAGSLVWLIVAAVIVMALAAGFLVYRNVFRKGGQDNE